MLGTVVLIMAMEVMEVIMEVIYVCMHVMEVIVY